jgi:hypothetical protein
VASCSAAWQFLDKTELWLNFCEVIHIVVEVSLLEWGILTVSLCFVHQHDADDCSCAGQHDIT